MGPWLIKALNVLLLGASCYLVADVVTEIGGEALEPSPLSTGQVRSETGAGASTNRVSPVSILDRNLFGAQLQGDTNVDALFFKILHKSCELPNGYFRVRNRKPEVACIENNHTVIVLCH